MADAPDRGKPRAPDATIVDEAGDEGTVPHAPAAQRPLDHPSSPKAVLVPLPMRRAPSGARPGVELTRNDSMREVPRAATPAVSRQPPPPPPGATLTESSSVTPPFEPSPAGATLIEPPSTTPAASLAPLETLPPTDPVASAPRMTFEPSVTDSTPADADRTYVDDSGPISQKIIVPPGPGQTFRYKDSSSTRPFEAYLTDKQFRRGVIALIAGAALTLFLTILWAFTLPETPTADLSHPTAIPHDKAPAKKATAAADKPPAAAVPVTGTVRIVTDPESNVFIDGRDLGPQPVSVTLPLGKNAVVLKNDKLGFKRTVTLDIPNQQGAIRFAFSQGWLEIDAPKDSRVTVDGKAVTGSHVQLWEGAHKVEVTHANKKKTHSMQLAEITAGMTTSVHFEAPSIADE